MSQVPCHQDPIRGVKRGFKERKVVKIGQPRMGRRRRRYVVTEGEYREERLATDRGNSQTRTRENVAVLGDDPVGPCQPQVSREEGIQKTRRRAVNGK